ncbi:MAG TPA: hypothetical protein VEA60_16020, partial [Allosphingosinicella sp.]|nr:hypothetical protein [Allosphingosinicella sp.]
RAAPPDGDRLMPAPDAVALAALGQTVVPTADFIWLDFVGTPVRACTWFEDVTLAATGDSELDGTYEAVDPAMLDIGDVDLGEGGSGALTITLSGIVGVDTSVLNLIGDRSKWYLRTVRLWSRVHDENLVQQGAIVAYYSGFMVDIRIVPRPDSQAIEVVAENYRSLLGEASLRTYMDQALFDAADQSARATVAAANGARTGPAAAVGSGGGFGGVVESAIRLVRKS